MQCLATENFLQGCKNRSAAFAAAEKKPQNLMEAIQEMRDAAANLKVFGKASNYAVRQVTFASDEDRPVQKKRDGGCSEEKSVLRLLSELLEQKGLSLDQQKPSFAQRRTTPPGTPPRNRSPSPNRCYKCQEPGHFARECKKLPVCYQCRQPGHLADGCPDRKKGTPPTSPKKSAPESSRSSNFSGVVNRAQSPSH